MGRWVGGWVGVYILMCIYIYTAGGRLESCIRRLLLHNPGPKSSAADRKFKKLETPTHP